MDSESNDSVTIDLNINGSKTVKVDAKKSESKKDSMKLTGKGKAQIIVAIDSTSYKEDEDGFHFHGKLSEPRLSLNGWIYFPQELAPQDGKTIPLTIDHEEAFTVDPKIRGSMTLSFDEDTWDLNYTAVTKDKEAIAGIKSGKYNYVSMTAEWEDEDKIRGWLVPKGVTTTHGSLVENPGITSATVKTDAFVSCCDGIYPLQKCDKKLLSEIKTHFDSKKPKSKNNSILKSSHKKKNNSSKLRMSKNYNEETLAVVLVEAIAGAGEEVKSEEEMKEQIANELEIHENVVENILNGDATVTDEFLAAFKKVTGVDESKLDAFKVDDEEEEEEEDEEEEEEKKDEEEEEEEKKPKKSSDKSKKSSDKKISGKKVTLKNDGKLQEIVVKIDTSDIVKALDI